MAILIPLIFLLIAEMAICDKHETIQTHTLVHTGELSYKTAVVRTGALSYETPGVALAYKPIGRTFQTTSGTTVYETGADTSKTVLIGIYDWFGFSTNIFQVADKIAKAGFLIVIPDFAHGANKVQTSPADNRDAFFAFTGSHNNDTAKVFESVKKDLKTLFAHYKSKGVTKFGVFGWCWGGRMVIEALSSSDLAEIEVGGMMHPAMLTADLGDKVLKPLVMIPTKQEEAVAPEFFAKVKAKFPGRSELHEFYDVNHGFSGGAGNFDDPAINKRVVELIKILAEYFKKELHTGQTYETTVALAYKPTGHIIQTEGIAVYETGSATSKTVLIGIYDWFGFSTNIFQVADKIAQAGFLIAIPDFAHGANTVQTSPATNRDPFFAFTGSHNNDTAKVFESVKADLKKLVTHYKSKYVTKFGVFGWCWGGRMVIEAVSSSELEEIEVGGMMHPAMLTADLGDKVYKPLVMIPTKQEEAVAPEFFAKVKAKFPKRSELHEFYDVNHGFSGGAGNFDDPAINKRVVELIKILSEYFKKELMPY